ncbi:hypothetical protein Tco_1140813 [Tanacetum coccineum]
MDEHNTKMQASVRPGLVNQFKNWLKEGNAVTFTADHGNELKCTLWSAFAQQFSDFLGTCSNHGKIIAVLQLAMMKIWDGKMCVQNGYNGTKLFTFDCTILIVDESFIDVKEYSERVFANQDVAESENTASRISTASKTLLRKVLSLRFLQRISQNSWMWHRRNWNHVVTLWNDKVQPVVDRSAYHLCEKYGKNADIFPTEITTLVGKRYAFKVSIDEYNAKKLGCPVFTMIAFESKATSSVAPSVNQLDLESQTDENTTPVNTGKISHATSGGKRPAEEDRGSESSNFKKKAVEVKIEKDA